MIKKSSDIIPGDIAGGDAWLSNFSNKLPSYAAKYGIVQADLDDMKHGYDWYHYWLTYHAESVAFTHKLTAYRNEVANGVKKGASASTMPTSPNVGTVPPSVPAGVFDRARNLVQRIKGHTNYTEADGNDLRIVPIQTVVNLNTVQPILTAQLVQAGKPELKWKKDGFVAIRVSADYGTGTFVFVAQPTKNTWVDKSPLPAYGTSAVWRYKAVYIDNDEEVGMVSPELSVTVTGHF